MSDQQKELIAILTTLLEEVREQGNETAEDIILNFMDCVTGWCGPKARLFK